MIKNKCGLKRLSKLINNHTLPLKIEADIVDLISEYMKLLRKERRRGIAFSNYCNELRKEE